MSNRDKNLVEMRMRAERIIEFCDFALESPLMDAVPPTKEADREMNQLRAHCKGLALSTRRYLLEHQPNWYALSREERSHAIIESFSHPAERADAQRIEGADAEEGYDARKKRIQEKFGKKFL